MLSTVVVDTDYICTKTNTEYNNAYVFVYS